MITETVSAATETRAARNKTNTLLATNHLHARSLPVIIPVTLILKIPGVLLYP
jgi:hypothetical protein